MNFKRDGICCEPGCEASIFARLRCRAHYIRLYRAKNPARYERYNIARRKAKRVAVCDECGEEFATAVPDQRFCSSRCRERAANRRWRRSHPEPWTKKRLANAQRRRARKKVGAGDRISLDEVRERDHDRCGLCGKRVGKQPWPHPMSASLDHLVPLSLGGAHTMANVQLAHLRCNSRKGARGGGEQLRLV